MFKQTIMLILACFLFTLPLQATSWRERSIDYVAHADVMIRGQVVQQSVIDIDGRLVTLSTIQVKHSYKGSEKGELLQLYQVGGDDGRFSSWIENVQHVEVGEHLILLASESKKLSDALNQIQQKSIRTIVSLSHRIGALIYDVKNERLIPKKSTAFWKDWLKHSNTQMHMISEIQLEERIQQRFIAPKKHVGALGRRHRPALQVIEGGR